MDSARDRQLQRLRQLEKLLVGRSGYVSTLEPLDDFYNDEPRGQGWVAQIPPNSHFPFGSAHSPRATGGRGRGDSARIKALMEAAERICLSTVPHKDLRYGPSAELDGCISAEEFPEPWRGSPVWQKPMHWCRASTIGTPAAESVLVPAQLVYCPYAESDEQAMLWDPSSNGAAAGFSPRGPNGARRWRRLSATPSFSPTTCGSADRKSTGDTCHLTLPLWPWGWKQGLLGSPSVCLAWSRSPFQWPYALWSIRPEDFRHSPRAAHAQFRWSRRWAVPSARHCTHVGRREIFCRTFPL